MFTTDVIRYTGFGLWLTSSSRLLGAIPQRAWSARTREFANYQ